MHTRRKLLRNLHLHQPHMTDAHLENWQPKTLAEQHLAPHWAAEESQCMGSTDNSANTVHGTRRVAHRTTGELTQPHNTLQQPGVARIRAHRHTSQTPLALHCPDSQSQQIRTQQAQDSDTCHQEPNNGSPWEQHTTRHTKSTRTRGRHHQKNREPSSIANTPTRRTSHGTMMEPERTNSITITTPRMMQANTIHRQCQVYKVWHHQTHPLHMAPWTRGNASWDQPNERGLRPGTGRVMQRSQSRSLAPMSRQTITPGTPTRYGKHNRNNEQERP